MTKDWTIDISAGSPILTYKGCSVIEGEQASYLLGLIEQDEYRIPIGDERMQELAELCGDAWKCLGHRELVLDTLLAIAIPLQREKQNGILCGSDR